MNFSTELLPRKRKSMPRMVSRSNQGGAALFVAVVALVLMTIAGLSMMRSVDTGNVIAGNIAFRAGAANAVDSGIEAAATYLNTTISSSPDANLPASCSIGTSLSSLGTCRYSSRTMPEGDDGLPFVNWNSANIPVTSLNGNDIQFVVERLCNPNVTVSLGSSPKLDDSKGLCMTTPVASGASNKAGVPRAQKVVEVMYRITVRVIGPHNTITMVQVIQGR